MKNYSLHFLILIHVMLVASASLARPEVVLLTGVKSTPDVESDGTQSNRMKNPFFIGLAQNQWSGGVEILRSQTFSNQTAIETQRETQSFAISGRFHPTAYAYFGAAFERQESLTRTKILEAETQDLESPIYSVSGILGLKAPLKTIWLSAEALPTIQNQEQTSPILQLHFRAGLQF